MNKLLKNSLALGTPVANLIILVVAVMLSVVVTTFAVSVTSNQAQRESLYLTKCHLWYINSTSSLGCLVVINNGPTDVVLSKITIKGQECVWNGTETYIVYNKTRDILSADMPYVSNFTKTGTNTVTIGDKSYTFQVAGDDFILKSGWTIMFYIVNPGNIIVYDVGTPVRITISTAQGVYCTETNVQSAT
ncbi:MAG: hypothetical protein RMJ15_01970 [Nitrososphaerota archaeon]|nr:hypothetical protein [Candidatus Bathyarchaeota archaeon]MDW8022500.1 hypothetical protein [Nitrososphaerota archaeon]